MTSPPALAVPSAVDYGTCSIPAGIPTATIYYGVGFNWAIIPGQSGNVLCTPAALAVPDPASGVKKTCEYLAIPAITPVAISASTPPTQAVTCAIDYGTCALPNDITATIYHGVGQTWAAIPERSGTVKCLSTSLGVADPAPGMNKSCLYVANPVLAAPPPAAIACAVDHGTCTLPAGSVATVYYGVGNTWYPIPAQSGSFTCLDTTFGVADPANGMQKSCRYVADSTATSLPTGATACAVDYGTCAIPSGVTATIYYGTGNVWDFIPGQTGNVACNYIAFNVPDPAPGKKKTYEY